MTQPTVLVLAGGVSKRFWPLRDKLLLRFGAYSLLERHIRQLRDLGCERFVVVARPETQADVAAMTVGLGDVRIVVQDEALGMADAVLSARAALTAHGDRAVYVTQAHDVVESQMHAGVLDAWAQKDAPVAGLIAAQRVSGYFPGGYLTQYGPRVTGIVEKPGAGREPSNLVALVAHVHGSAEMLLAALQEEQAKPGADDAYERALTRLMGRSEYRAHVYDGRWQALKFPWHTLDVVDMLLDLWQRGVESPGEAYEQREPGVFIGPNVKQFPGSWVVAPALLDEGVVVGQGALVRASIIGPRCVVGFGSEVARSLLVEGVELHHNYVGDSVMDRGSSMGYGAVTANYRLDHQSIPSVVAGERIDTGRDKLGAMIGADVRIGVNASTMPGVKLGAGAWLASNLPLNRDLPDGERYLKADG
jgi:UDP-N-acetylglucosamine diphosphorylase / glucose-1-phosphate thymidylyltransferase / UDP-N-acetylgalactosamine diphosphorylase / glucosamine-1-phosphate N-acetyltransferase / galactosamine-1-phosphate N-acetyltransferase